jgi:hypothetical protein
VGKKAKQVWTSQFGGSIEDTVTGSHSQLVAVDEIGLQWRQTDDNDLSIGRRTML